MCLFQFLVPVAVLTATSNPTVGTRDESFQKIGMITGHMERRSRKLKPRNCAPDPYSKVSPPIPHSKIVPESFWAAEQDMKTIA